MAWLVSREYRKDATQLSIEAREAEAEPTRRFGYRETAGGGVEVYSEGYGPIVVVAGLVVVALLILGRT